MYPTIFNLFSTISFYESRQHTSLLVPALTYSILDECQYVVLEIVPVDVSHSDKAYSTRKP